ncbi:hypothetical protein HXX76_000519 [Chlamydomonas incerta]|uniref:Uncharacterized protein n=1 Tax=Chlamydomonas incerta TaxID=51695 RepID=A0A835WEH7_CHLIN|nr:hypothetical protein HXX76_000519 [Chlamydomonas incerta]|eukprot:KAG2445916.1 hypothetical protein HXX76_000519 [Chlamydomonas incerta]
MSGKKPPGLRSAPEQTAARIGRAFAACSAKAELYGACIKKLVPEVDVGVCSKEFQELKTCFTRAMRSGSGRA